MKTIKILTLLSTIIFCAACTKEDRVDFVDADIPFGYTKTEQNEMRDPNYGLPHGTIFNPWDNVCIHPVSKDTTDKKDPPRKGINVVHPHIFVPIFAEE